MTSSGQVYDLDSKELNVIMSRTWSGIGHKPQEHGSLFNMLPFLTLITFN